MRLVSGGVLAFSQDSLARVLVGRATSPVIAEGPVRRVRGAEGRRSATHRGSRSPGPVLGLTRPGWLDRAASEEVRAVDLYELWQSAQSRTGPHWQLRVGCGVRWHALEGFWSLRRRRFRIRHQGHPVRSGGSIVVRVGREKNSPPASRGGSGGIRFHLLRESALAMVDISTNVTMRCCHVNLGLVGWG